MIKIEGKRKAVFLFSLFFLFSFFFYTANAQNYPIPNDGYYAEQWYLKRINFNTSWNFPLRGDSPVIAIIDSGIDIDHPDLSANIWTNIEEIKNNSLDDDHNGFIDDFYGWNFVDNNSDPRPILSSQANDDGLNHGTMVAGIIAAEIDNFLGISGIAGKSKIMALKALDENGEGRINDVVRAIDYAIHNGADIINLSFTGNTYHQGFEEVVKRAQRAGVIIVSTAGNQGSDLNQNPGYPACFNSDLDNLIIVSSLDAMDQKAIFSSYGSKCVDVSAPGVSFFSTSFYDVEDEKHLEYQGYWSGTSMSTAVVTGVLGLIKQINPKLNYQELIEVLLKSSDNIDSLNPIYKGQLGAGRVNAFDSARWADEKWQSLSGRFLFFPQTKVGNYETEQNLYTLISSDHRGKNISTASSDGDLFLAGNSISIGSVGGDGDLSLVIGAGVGEDPVVKILDIQGNVKGQFLAYNQNFKGGVNVAVGDIDGDGIAEIITGAGPSGGPHVRIFDIKGDLKGQFFAYDQNFKGGVNVAVGDIDGDGMAEIITGAGPGGGPHVRVFDNQANLRGQFFAYENEFRGGVKVAVANIYGQETKNKKEIVVAPGSGRKPEVKVFDNFGKENRSILAYSERFQGGVNLAIGDLDKDGLDEIIVGAGPGGSPHIRAFDSRGLLKASFYGANNDFLGGIVPAYINI